MNKILAIVFLVGRQVGLAAASCQCAMAAGPALDGKEIYSENCATCHGEQLRNTSNGVTFDLRKLKPEEHERFVNSVVHGKNDMPPWQGVLDPDQIEDIWAYIRATVDR
jgi:cytochrome c6